MPTEAEKRFIEGWRYAAPRLEELRDKELRDLDEAAGLKMIGAGRESNRATSGLMEFQAWMMRLRVLRMQEQVAAEQSSRQKLS